MRAERRCTRWDGAFRKHCTCTRWQTTSGRKKRSKWAIGSRRRVRALFRRCSRLQEQFYVNYFWSGGVVYAAEVRLDAPSGNPLFRCDLVERKWKKLPLQPAMHDLFVPLVNPVDGEDDGLLVVQQKWQKNEREQWRRHHTIQRHMLRFVPFCLLLCSMLPFDFRNVDSLLHCSLAAVRKSREGVGGEESFHRKMSAPPFKILLPSPFEGMLPIPLRCRRCCAR